jgi:PAS domain S-box-containing protein
MRTNRPRRTPTARGRERRRSGLQDLSDRRIDEAITAAQERVAKLEEQAEMASRGKQQILSRAFQELQSTLEELQVADEELRQQNEELALARQIAEVERQRYRELFELAPDAYLVTDIVASIQEANQAAAALLAVPKHRLRGKPLVLFIQPAEQRMFHERLIALSRRRGVHTWEIRLQPRHRAPLYAAVTTAAVHDAQGQLGGFRWLLRDISERKAAQERAQQAEQALQHSRRQTEAPVLEKPFTFADIRKSIQQILHANEER